MNSSKKRLFTGFSLVELMVAITISLVLLTGLIQVFLSSKRSYQIQDSIARMQENGRYALEVLNKDLRLAGYLGGNADTTTIGAANTPNGVTPITDNGLCGSAVDTQWGRMLNRGVFGINEGIDGYNGCITAADSTPNNTEYLNGDILTVRYAQPLELNDGENVDRGGFYLVSSPMGSALSLLNRNDTITTGGILDNPKTYNRVEAFAYYVGHQDTDCNGNATRTPALHRVFIEPDGTPRTEELVRGVENLQVQYGEDSDGDGTLDQYRNADDVTNWQSIQTIRLWLLVRDECPSPSYTNNNVYVMGDFTFDPSGAEENFRRHLYTSTITLRN